MPRTASVPATLNPLLTRRLRGAAFVDEKKISVQFHRENDRRSFAVVEIREGRVAAVGRRVHFKPGR
jgi:hypothetical protein